MRNAEYGIGAAANQPFYSGVSRQPAIIGPSLRTEVGREGTTAYNLLIPHSEFRTPHFSPFRWRIIERKRTEYESVFTEDPNAGRDAIVADHH